MKDVKAIRCPLCNDPVDKLLYRFHFENEQAFVEKIRQEFPDWMINDGICSRCVDFFHSEIILQQKIIPALGAYTPVKTADDFIVIPTSLRLDADPRYTGKNCTICFIDNGFYPHPDLTSLRNRIRLIKDLTNEKEEEGMVAEAHGTMTSVVAAGDGFLSNGLYKGIASDANLVLLKVQDSAGRIQADYFIRALEWIEKHHAEFEIRIINVSLGLDAANEAQQSRIGGLIEKLYESNIIIVAAVGNNSASAISLPASSAKVIAVGGLDDENKIDPETKHLYHSNFGRTAESAYKPDLIAHSIWIAAPILPQSDLWKKAQQVFSSLESLSTGKSEQEESTTESLLKEIHDEYRINKFISRDYMHVDGTSFAAPIVCSVLAQLLEIDPSLRPSQLKEIIFSTATRIPKVEARKQGFGLIQPRKAILRVLNAKSGSQTFHSPTINYSNRTIEFSLHKTDASQISLAGSFNNWNEDILYLQPCTAGEWKVQIPLLEAGKYEYKFLVDGKHWIEDYKNDLREPDGFAGFNSIFIIQKQKT